MRVVETDLDAGRSPWSQVRRLAAHPLARSVVSTGGVNVAIALAGSLAGVVLARVLGPTARGDLVTLTLWPAAAGTVASLGVTQATCYFLASGRRGTFTSFSPGKVAGTAGASAAMLGIVVAVAGLAVGPRIGRNALVDGLLVVLFLLSPLYITTGVWASALQAVDFRRWNTARACQPAAYMLAIVLLWGFGMLSLRTAVFAFAAAQLVQWVAGLVLLRSVLAAPFEMSRRLLRPMYHYGARAWISSVPEIVNVRIDMLMLSVLPAVPPAALGNYAVAVSLSGLALPLAVAFGSVAFPQVAAGTTEQRNRRIEFHALVGAGGAASVVLVALCVLAPWVVPRLFGDGFRDAVGTLWLLAPGTVFLALKRVIRDILAGRGRPGAPSAAEAVGAVSTIALLAVLVPRFGIYGAALASTIAYALVLVVLLYLLHAVRAPKRTAPLT